ncbi:hypothetical protein AAFN85_28225 [Mucilaginibacter sp. CAU 1740]
MSRLIVDIEDEKMEKAVRAIFDALGLDYAEQRSDIPEKSLTLSEQVIYDRLKKSAREIRLYKEGKIKLQDAGDLLNEL